MGVFVKTILSYLRRSGKGRTVLAAILSFGDVCALPWALSLEGGWLGYTNSILAVFLFLGLFWLVRRALDSVLSVEKRRGEISCEENSGEEISSKEKSCGDASVEREACGGGKWLLPGLLGTLFSVCMVFGAQLDTRERVPFHSGGMWGSILILSVSAALLTRFFWDLPAWTGRKEEGAWGEISPERQAGRKRLRGLFFRALVIFLLCFPVFLAVYPGFFVYDAQDELLQVVTRNFSTHHPLFHVLLLGGIIQSVYKITGSYNLGIACYTLLQMGVMSFIFAGCVEILKDRGLRRPWRMGLTLYFGLCPVLVMFSLCSAKDGLFTGMLLITVLLLQELCTCPEKYSGARLLAPGASALFMMLLRHNGFYAFCVFAVACTVYLRNYRKKMAVFFGAVILLYLGVNAALTGIFHADASENQEILTVPISQIARVYSDQGDDLPRQEREILHRYLSEEALSRYTPRVSDGVKIHFDNQAYRADRKSFLKLWLKWGAEHPFTYLNAWFMTSYGFWYPDTVIDVYRGNTVFTFTYEDSSYFGYEVEEPGSRESRIPWLDECYRRMSLEIAQQRIPVLSMLFSPGFLFWVMAFLMGFLWDKGYRRETLPFLLPLLCWLTVILGPTYLVRYVVFLWVIVPVLCFTCRRAGGRGRQ